MLFAVAVPTFLSVRAAANGETWFANGVPSSWTRAQLGDTPSGTVVEAAWRVPGPGYGSDFPIASVLKLKTAFGSQVTTAEWLEAAQQAASDRGWSASQVSLSDGAPALAVSVPTDAGPVGGAPGVQTGLYGLYAKSGSDYYFVGFQTDATNFASEAAAVAGVLRTFKGSD
jgi:hypothetical protein